MGNLLTASVGVVFVLIAYAMNQSDRWEDDFFWYDSFNLAGAWILMSYAWDMAAWPLVILFGAWGALAGYDIFKRERQLRKDISSRKKG